MAIKFGYFNSKNGNRKYDANDFNFLLKRLVSNGVYPNPGNNLQVVAGTGMNVVVKAGGARIEWRWFEMDADMALSIDPSDLTLGRKDRVVLKLDLIDINISLLIKKGSAASVPEAPELIRNSEIYEFSLAVIDIPKQATAITQAQIHDTRLDSSVCGVIGNMLQIIDTQHIYDQYTSAAEADRKKNQSDFDIWFDSVKTSIGQIIPVKQFESYYITKQTGETNIPIGISQFNKITDILNVYVNGLRLTSTLDYSIKDNGNITLVKSLSVIGTTVTFIVLKSMEQTT